MILFVLHVEDLRHTLAVGQIVVFAIAAAIFQDAAVG